MHPALTDAARAALRSAPIDLPDAGVEAIRELVRWHVIEPIAGAVSQYRLTILGARYLLHLLVSEAEAVPCRCGELRAVHDVRAPHASQVPGSRCRSFTPARPLYAPAQDGATP